MLLLRVARGGFADQVADPNAGGPVQASQAGRIEAGPPGLPVLALGEESS